MRSITFIAAVSLNGIIGGDNKLLWHIPEDLKHFKDTTKGRVVIMGRKTFESLDEKPLPGRINIVISSKYTSNPVTEFVSTQSTTCIIRVKDFETALDRAKRVYAVSPDAYDIFVIGGGSIYSQYIHSADKLIISHVHKPFEGDVKFPDIDLDVWAVENIDHRLDASIPFTIVTYVRKP